MLHRLIKAHNGAQAAPTPSPLDLGLGFTVRFDNPDDDADLRRLAAFDSQRPLAGRVLVAEVDGELWAAVGIEDRRAIADPFRHTAALVAVLRQRASDLASRSDPRQAASQTRLNPAFH